MSSARSPGPRFGVIAEDETDCAVVRVLVQRIHGRDAAVKHHAAKGCSNIPRKAGAWMRVLAQKGYTSIVLLQDRDQNDERALRRRLEEIPRPEGVERLVCIPVEELEAWFWADGKVLSHVAGRPIEAEEEPHRVRAPKEALARLSRDEKGRARYTTGDNADLAARLDPEECARRCRSFRDLLGFVRGEPASPPA